MVRVLSSSMNRKASRIAGKGACISFTICPRAKICTQAVPVDFEYFEIVVVILCITLNMTRKQSLIDKVNVSI